MPYFGQEIFEKAEAKGPLTDKEYLDALEKDLRLSRRDGIDRRWTTSSSMRSSRRRAARPR